MRRYTVGVAVLAVTQLLMIGSGGSTPSRRTNLCRVLPMADCKSVVYKYIGWLDEEVQFLHAVPILSGRLVNLT